MTTRKIIAAAILALLLVSGARLRLAEASVLYAVDALGNVNHDDITLGQPPATLADLWWANQFDVQPGGERITEIGLSFGNNLTVGNPVSLLVYDDPNNDGLPTDLVLLQQTIVNVTESDGTFDQPTFFNIPPTPVSGKFFIAALHLSVPGNAGITFHNEAGTSLGRSFIGASITNPGTFDPSDVVVSSVDLAPATIDDLGVPGNWVLRATGVPEPGGFLAVSLGLMGLSLLRQRNRATGRPSRRTDGKSA